MSFFLTSISLSNVLVGQMDQVQEHTHTYDLWERTTEAVHTVYPGQNYIRTGDMVEETIGTSDANSGRSGEETRVKNISIRLWQRIN